MYVLKIIIIDLEITFIKLQYDYIVTKVILQRHIAL
jgi:hypothetical protein